MNVHFVGNSVNANFSKSQISLMQGPGVVFCGKKGDNLTLLLVSFFGTGLINVTIQIFP